MSTYTLARDYLVTVISAIPDIGLVHNRERYIGDKAKFLEAFVSEITSGHKQVRGWCVTLDGGVEAGDAVMGDPVQRTWKFVVYGIQGVQDSAATEHTFYGLVEDVMNAIDDASPTWGGIPGMVVDSADPAQARELGVRQFGSPICHYAEIYTAIWVDRA